MTKTKSTKRALLLSALSLLMCVSMLIGSTFAWFTDSVTSAGNKIQAGTLKLDLELLNKETGKFESIKKDSNPIFDYDKWEPGYTDVKVLKVENEGNLALKWYAKFVCGNKLSILANVIDVYVCTTATQMPDSRSLDNYAYAGTVAEFVDTIEETTYGNLKAGESAYLGIALKMQESAGNDYQGLTLGSFDIQILATQDTVEGDSFDDQYDKDSEYPVVVTGTKAAAQPLTLTTSLDDEHKVEVVIPAAAEDGSYALVIPPESIEVANDTIAFDMHLELNGEKVSPVPGVEYTGTITLPHPFVTVSAVYHNGEKIAHEHKAGEAEVSFTVSDFSPFKVVYEDHTDDSLPMEYEIVNDKCIITAGMFVGKNPVAFDASLADADSEYIAVDFVKDGTKYYVVSERATTVFLSADETAEYKCENGTFSVTKAQSGKLYSAISGLQSKEHSTVYLLPGTYNEGTAINVYSSMDIIGLGNTKDIKIVKVKGSYSNRHLFNCNGAVAREEHIEVSLHNLTLDATAKNLNSAGKFYWTDNGAVQSIRLSKVKCYDLNIVKSSGYAFYVNGKYDTRGAYLYAQDCTMTTNSVVDTASTYRFYYDNLTYGKGEYTNSTSYIKNTAMAADDWNWD